MIEIFFWFFAFAIGALALYLQFAVLRKDARLGYEPMAMFNGDGQSEKRSMLRELYAHPPRMRVALPVGAAALIVLGTPQFSAAMSEANNMPHIENQFENPMTQFLLRVMAVMALVYLKAWLSVVFGASVLISQLYIYMVQGGSEVTSIMTASFVWLAGTTGGFAEIAGTVFFVTIVVSSVVDALLAGTGELFDG